MKDVIADTSPINYLILIGCIDILPGLYGKIVVPEEVFDELTATGAPASVDTWARTPPAWLTIQVAPEQESVEAY